MNRAQVARSRPIVHTPHPTRSGTCSGRSPSRAGLAEAVRAPARGASGSQIGSPCARRSRCLPQRVECVSKDAARCGGGFEAQTRVQSVQSVHVENSEPSPPSSQSSSDAKAHVLTHVPLPGGPGIGGGPAGAGGGSPQKSARLSPQSAQSVHAEQPEYSAPSPPSSPASPQQGSWACE